MGGQVCLTAGAAIEATRCAAELDSWEFAASGARRFRHMRVAGTLTRNDMAVVRMRLGGRDWGDLQRLPSAPRPSRDPLGLKRPVLELLAENISANSTAALELSRDAPGTALMMPPYIKPRRSEACTAGCDILPHATRHCRVDASPSS